MRRISLLILVAMVMVCGACVAQNYDTARHVLIQSGSYHISPTSQANVWSRHDSGATLPMVAKMEAALQEIVEQDLSHGPAPKATDFSTWAKIDDQKRVFVYLYPSLGKSSSDIMNDLIPRGIFPVGFRADIPTVSVWIPIDSLPSIAGLSEISSIRLVIDPLKNAGSVTPTGDSLIHGPSARNHPFARGNGVTVGILSDDCGSHPTDHASDPVLPLSSVNILDDTYSVGTRSHEGLAMLDIVHAVAPLASLAFAQGCSDKTTFASNIIELATAGHCNVLCDDITWPDEPYFEDGDIANSINQVTRNNDVFYVTSAGNFAQDVDSFNYIPTTPPFSIPATNGSETVNNFGSGNTCIWFHAGNRETVDIRLQWDDLFHFPRNHFYLIVYELGTNKIIEEVLSNDMAMQGIQFSITPAVNTLGAGNFGILIMHEGTVVNNPRLVLFVHINNPYFHPQNVNGALSILGSGMCANAMTCGAVNVTNPGVAESYSSRGPSNKITNPYSMHKVLGSFVPFAPLTTTDRKKPELVGPDYVTTNVSCWPTFSGTSAAAPHVAGVAAIVKSLLMLSHKPNTPTRIRLCILKGIADTYPDARWNSSMGNGLLDADGAITEAMK